LQRRWFIPISGLGDAALMQNRCNCFGLAGMLSLERSGFTVEVGSDCFCQQICPVAQFAPTLYAVSTFVKPLTSHTVKLNDAQADAL
jgi:hypothetical protein